MSGTKTMCKWINNNTFLAISDFVDKRFLDNFAFGRLRTSSDFFGRLRTSSGIFGNDRVVCKNPRTPRIKISRLNLRKSWQVYLCGSHIQTLKMTTTQVVETSVTVNNNSPIQDYVHPDDQTQPTFDNTLCCSSKILHQHCFEFLLRRL